MARPTLTGLDAGPGIAPEVRQAPSLQVHAPLNVQAAPSGAEQLAEALGLVNKVAQPVLRQKVEKDAFNRTSAGQSDAVLNKVDAKREAEDNLYARGVKFATKERSVRNALAEVDRKIAEVGADMSPQERAQQRDAMLKEVLGDMVNDPESAGIAARLIEPWQQRNLAADNIEVIKEAQDKTLAAEGENIKDGMADGSFNYAESIKRLAPVIGREQAVEYVIDQVGVAAVNLRDEELINKMLPEKITTEDGQTIDGPRSAQRHQDRLDKYRELAKKARLDAAFQVRREGKAEFETRWLTDPESFTLRDYDKHIKAKDSLFTSDELNSYLTRAKAARESRLSQLDTTSIRAGYPNVRLRMFLGTLAPDGKAYSSEDLQKVANREIEESAAGTGRAVEEVASEFTALEGYVYQPIANDLQKIPPSDTELWPKAVEQYFKLSPKVREVYVPDADKRALFERSKAYLAAGKKPTEIGELLDQQDDNVIRANRAAMAEKWNKKLEGLRNREVNDGGVFGLKTTIGQLANAPAIAADIRQRAQVRVDNGVDPETAIENATQEVTASHVYVEGPDRSRSMLLPRTSDITDGFGEPVKWLYENMPAFLKQRGLTVDPNRVRLTTVPSSGQNTVLTLVDVETGMPVDLGLRLDPAGITADYTRATNAAAYAAAQEAQRTKRRRMQGLPLTEDEMPTRFLAR